MSLWHICGPLELERGAGGLKRAGRWWEGNWGKGRGRGAGSPTVTTSQAAPWPEAEGTVEQGAVWQLLFAQSEKMVSAGYEERRKQVLAFKG